MQIYLTSTVNKTNLYTNKLRVSEPKTNEVRNISSTNVVFNANPLITKTISSQILHEKSKLMKQINDILAQEVKILTSDEKLKLVIKQAASIINTRKKKLKELDIELDATINSPYLNPQQKNDRVMQLKKQYNQIDKLKVQEPIEEKPSKDNYDFTLINKFKTAILNDNFDLAKIEENHYQNFENITTVKEFKKKYPSIRIPESPYNVIVNKIFNTLNRKFYTDLYSVYIKNDENKTSDVMMKFFQDYFNKLSEQFENKNGEELLDTFCIDVAKKILAILERKRFADELISVTSFENLNFTDNFDDIPISRKNSIAKISDNDKFLLDIDYDSFVMNTIKKMYLNKEKLNQIEYIENDKKIKISAIKSREYQFEKIPEKMKKIIADAKKIEALQRDYQKFTNSELKSRLTYYTATEIGDNDELFNLIVDFDSCKFTEEDRIYLIKFIKLLDKIIDKELTASEVVNAVKENKIHPRGTVKLNELERKKIEEKIKIEQQKLIALNNLRAEFDEMMNLLYETDLSQMAEDLMKYYPETINDDVLKEVNKIMEFVKEGLASKNLDEVKKNFTRWEIYNEYLKTLSDTEEFKNAINYGKGFQNQLESRVGQYLLNRELVDAYPTSIKIAKNPLVFTKIMEKFAENKDLATIYLCKYEDYALMNDNEKESILSLLKHFDYKNYDDRIILKNIIEEDYINNETILKANENGQDLKVVIAPKAKKAILDKYKFPGCMDLFVSFEEALSMRARETGTAGIKKTGANNDALDYKMEVKIKGRTDRLFSSKNDYVFDIYSERGLH